MNFDPVRSGVGSISANILHNGSNHWFAVCRVFGDICLFDSLWNPKTVYSETVVKALHSIYYSQLANSKLRVKLMNVHRQSGGTHCGYFAVGYIVDLLSGNDPTTLRYIQYDFFPYDLRLILTEQV
jgi:hypothetical protein